MPILNQDMPIRYEPRSVVHDMLGPLDRLPGLHVGQRWEIAGDQSVHRPGRQRAGRGGAKGLDQLGRQPGAAHSRSCSTWVRSTMRTWVRPDGVILRQEVPFPFVRLVLERRPDTDDASSNPQTRVPGP